MNTAKDHNHERKNNKSHQLIVKLRPVERGNISTTVGFLWAQQMSPPDDICRVFTHQICLVREPKKNKNHQGCLSPV